MQRLLCIVGGMNRGGAETFLMKLYRQLDRTRYQMDFCVASHTPGDYDEEIRQLGGRILYTTPKSKNPLASFWNMYKIVKGNKYLSVLRISQHSLSSLELLAARLAGANKVIFRSSNTQSCGSCFNRLLHHMFIPLAYIIPTVRIAPSREAAQFMFGTSKGVHILHNGLDTQIFKFSLDSRQKIRQELKAQDKFVIGHIGRFNFQKNHPFLLQIFAEIKKQRINAELWLIGKGELENQIKKQAELLGILDDVQFLGVRADIPALLSAMDVFVFPSLFEGMPNTVIEAQNNGLACLISNTITKQAQQTDLVHFMSLQDNFGQWANKTLEIYGLHASQDRSCAAQELYMAGYDIKQVLQVFVSLVFGEKNEIKSACR